MTFQDATATFTDTNEGGVHLDENQLPHPRQARKLLSPIALGIPGKRLFNKSFLKR